LAYCTVGQITLFLHKCKYARSAHGLLPGYQNARKKKKRDTRTWFCIVRIPIRAAQPAAIESKAWYRRVSGGGIRGYPGVVSWGIRGYPGYPPTIWRIAVPQMVQITMTPVTQKGILGGGSKCYIILEGAQRHFGAPSRTSTCNIVRMRSAGRLRRARSIPEFYKLHSGILQDPRTAAYKTLVQLLHFRILQWLLFCPLVPSLSLSLCQPCLSLLLPHVSALNRCTVSCASYTSLTRTRWNARSLWMHFALVQLIA
jgi:hypothetical protein